MANAVEEEVAVVHGEQNVVNLGNVSSGSSSSLFADFYRAHQYAPREKIKTRAELERIYSKNFKVSAQIETTNHSNAMNCLKQMLCCTLC